MSVRWAIWGLLSPSQVLAATAVTGGLLVLLGRKRVGQVLCIAGAIGLLLFGFLPGAHYLARPLEKRFLIPELPPKVTGIILLAGSERPAASDAFGEPQTGSHGSRYVTALRLAQRYPDAVLVYSGGPMVRAGTGPLGTQSAVAAEILRGVGVAPARLRFDTESRDTCAHAGNVQKLVVPRRGETWIVVSSAMHMPRVVACFRAAGWKDFLPYPTDHRVVTGAWDRGTFLLVRNLEVLDLAAHEWIGLAYYRAAGRTRELFPAP